MLFFLPSYDALCINCAVIFAIDFAPSSNAGAVISGSSSSKEPEINSPARSVPSRNDELVAIIFVGCVN